MAEFLFVIKVAKDQCSDSQCEDLKTAEVRAGGEMGGAGQKNSLCPLENHSHWD